MSTVIFKHHSLVTQFIQKVKGHQQELLKLFQQLNALKLSYSLIE